MLIDVHLRNSDGTPGRLFDTIDRDTWRREGWVRFNDEDYPLLTGFARAFIVVPEEKTKTIKRPTHKGARGKGDEQSV